MAECLHVDLEYLGSQKTDNGQNRYLRCKSCGELIVVMADDRILGVKGVGDSAGAKEKQTSPG